MYGSESVAKEGGALSGGTPKVERDPVTGHARLLGELDFAVVPAARAELALSLIAPDPRVVDLSDLDALSPSGATFLEELLDDGVVLRCRVGCPAHEALVAAGLADRVEIVPGP